jgi:bla regulator protein BlaR1
MLVWMLYVIVVSALLGSAALAAEYAGRMRRGPTRWLWALSMVASLLVPAIIASVSVQLPSIPNIVSPGASQKIVSLRDATSKSLSPANWMSVDARRLSARPYVDTLLRRGWGAASSILLLGLLASGVHLNLRKRRWKRGSLAGASVYITENVGPAVVGLLRPRIAVPRWLCEAPAVTQQLVIAHEKAHLDAHDVRLLTAGVLLLVGMPWNLPMWWQLRRLRYAIEVDCDARILSTGRDATSYGETLITVGERQAGFIGAVAGMSESKSFLEERIKLMVRKPVRWWQVSMAALGGLSLVLVAMAAQVEPPNAADAAEEHHEIAVDSSVLSRYTGAYKFGDTEFMMVTREGQQLSAQITGQKEFPIYPETTTRFFYKVVDAQINFVSDGQTNATSLVIHQHGQDRSASRVDPEIAQQYAAYVWSRVQNQTPLPGSEEAIRRFVASTMAGSPNYSEMTPEQGEGFRPFYPSLQKAYEGLGAVRSITFRGVGELGMDIYLVVFEKGVMQYRISVANGLITGLSVRGQP